MWIISELGFIHSARISMVMQPLSPNDKTLRVMYDGKEVRVLREDALAVLGNDFEESELKRLKLGASLRHDNGLRKDERELRSLKDAPKTAAEYEGGSRKLTPVEVVKKRRQQANKVKGGKDRQPEAV